MARLPLVCAATYLASVACLAGGACKEESSPTPASSSPASQGSALPRVVVPLECDEREQTLEVTGDRRIDAQLCGHHCAAIEVAGATRSEVLRSVDRREVVLRRARDHAFVEIRSPGAPTVTIDHVRVIACSSGESTEAAPPTFELVIDEHTESLTGAQLRERLRAAGLGKRVIPMCAVAAVLAPRYTGIEIAGSPAFTVTRAECERRGDLVLKINSRGQLHLRTTSNDRVVVGVTRITLR